MKWNNNKSYQDYLKTIKEVKDGAPAAKRSGNEVIPPPPSLVRNEIVEFGSVPFHVLILNGQLTEKEFHEIHKEVIRKKPSSSKITFGNFTKTSLEEIQKGGTGVAKFREYGYPILIENKLILYSNNYFFSDGFSSGEGRFDVYEKIAGQWIKINSITKWIT